MEGRHGSIVLFIIYVVACLLGEQAMVDEAQKALEEAEALKRLAPRPEPTSESSKYTDIRITDQKLRLCDICGTFLSVYDNDRRLADHFGGKLHLGYMLIREKRKELQVNSSTFGDSIILVYTQQNLHTERTSTELSPLNLGTGYGSLGPLENVNSLSGSPFRTGVGQPIALHAEEWNTLRNAPCVIRRKKQFSTFLPNVSSQDRYGLPFCRH